MNGQQAYREKGGAMKISDIIREALEKKGLRNLKDASKHLEISPELLRVTINKGHIPKDKTLILIANKLKLDKSLLVLAAHREKVPIDVKGFFLSPSQSKFGSGRRKYPLSAEQCAYLGKIMSQEEIQVIRKFRQVSEEGKTQILGYVDYMFASKKSG
jgi:hypothetical protein